MSHDISLTERICNICHVALMEPHPTNTAYIKCPICGNCKLKQLKSPVDYNSDATDRKIRKIDED